VPDELKNRSCALLPAREGGRAKSERQKRGLGDRRVASRYLVAALRRVFQLLARARAIPRGDSSIPEFASNGAIGAYPRGFRRKLFGASYGKLRIELSRIVAEKRRAAAEAAAPQNRFDPPASV